MVTDYDIQALVDNELDDDQRERVEHYIDRHPEAKERYDMLVEQKRLLQIWWQNKRLH